MIVPADMELQLFLRQIVRPLATEPDMELQLFLRQIVLPLAPEPEPDRVLSILPLAAALMSKSCITLRFILIVDADDLLTKKALEVKLKLILEWRL